MPMLTDRPPILLANARVIDPSRDFDGPGDVLIADGTIRDLRRGIGAAGVPEGNALGTGRDFISALRRAGNRVESIERAPVPIAARDP